MTTAALIKVSTNERLRLHMCEREREILYLNPVLSFSIFHNRRVIPVISFVFFLLRLHVQLGRFSLCAPVWTISLHFQHGRNNLATCLQFGSHYCKHHTRASWEFASCSFAINHIENEVQSRVLSSALLSCITPNRAFAFRPSSLPYALRTPENKTTCSNMAAFVVRFTRALAYYRISSSIQLASHSFTKNDKQEKKG